MVSLVVSGYYTSNNNFVDDNVSIQTSQSSAKEEVSKRMKTVSRSGSDAAVKIERHLCSCLMSHSYASG